MHCTPFVLNFRTWDDDTSSNNSGGKGLIRESGEVSVKAFRISTKPFLYSEVVSRALLFFLSLFHTSTITLNTNERL